MTIKIGVFGSYPSRDVFNSKINPDLDDIFEFGLDITGSSIISAVQSSFDYDEESIKILPENEKNIDLSNEIKNDFNRSFLKDIEEANLDYLIIDNYNDACLGILCANDKIVTNNPNLKGTDFYENLNVNSEITIQNNKEEFLERYYESCEMLFSFLEEKCPNMQVILNPIRHNFIHQSNSGFKFTKDYKELAKKNNKFIKQLDQYIIENYDVQVLFHENESLIADYKANSSSLTFVPSYYKFIEEQILEMDKYVQLSKDNKDPSIYEMFKQYRRMIFVQNAKVNKVKNMALVGDYEYVTKRIGDIIFKEYHLTGSKLLNSGEGKLRAYYNYELMGESDLVDYKSTIFMETHMLPQGINTVCVIYFDSDDIPRDSIEFKVDTI